WWPRRWRSGCCPRSPWSCATTWSSWRASRTPTSPAGRTTRRPTPSPCTGRPGRWARWRPAGARSPGCGAWGRRWSTPGRASWPRPWPTPTCRSRRRAGSDRGSGGPGPLAGGGELVPAAVQLAERAGDAPEGRRPPLDDDPGDEGQLDDDADAHPQGGRPDPPGDEALDQPGGDEGEHQPQRDDAGAPGLLAERPAPGAVAGVDHGPAEPEPGGAGDHDRRQLEQAVGEDQPEEPAQLPGVGEQPAGHPDVGAVVRQHEDGRHAQQDAGGEGGDGHLDVVDGDRGGELRRRVGGVVGLEVVLQVGGAGGLGGEGVQRLVAAGDPGADDQGGHEQQGGARGDEPPALPDGGGEPPGEEL